jgi:large repetitive protein
MKKAINHMSKASVLSAVKALGVVGVLACGMISQSTVAWADIDNIATVDGTYQGNPVSAQSALVSVPVSKRYHITVTKVADKKVNVVAGEVITYTYTVVNDGDVVVHNLTLSDVHNAAGAAPVPGSETLTDLPPTGDSVDAIANDGVWTDLAPGDKIKFTATYTVQQSDVDNLQ